MNLFNDTRAQILGIVQQLQAEGALPRDAVLAGIDVMPPREAGHGDMATNAAMILAAKCGKKPKELADVLAERIKKIPHVVDAVIAGPGFINITFAAGFWQKIVSVILREGTAFGQSSVGHGRKIDIEYVSANPTGPMHVGHGRGAVVGDALASLLQKAGFAVTREYYINDAGAQVDVLARSAYLRYREACGEAIGEIPEGLYPGDYLVPVGAALAKAHGKKWLGAHEKDWLPEVRRFTIEAMLALIKQDLAQLGIHHDVFTSERALSEAGKVEEAVQLLDEKGLIYSGVLEPPKGKPTPQDWEARPQTLFRSSQFGDDSDRPVKKSDGSWAYFTPDIAYHLDKYQRGFQEMILVLGADHVGYQKRLKAAVQALSDGKAHLEIKLCQLVRFLRGGEPVKMSKRKGTFMTVREVVDEVGNGVFRFIMLTRKNDMPLDFDFAKVMEQSKDNPVFYVQYAHARAQSALRMGKQDMGTAWAFSESPTPEQLALLTHTAELELLRLLASWPRQVEAAATAFEPHRIAFYLQEVAASFHGLWNLGNTDIGLRFIQKDAMDVTAARLSLVRACATVIASGLQVLGVEPLMEMR